MPEEMILMISIIFSIDGHPCFWGIDDYTFIM